MRDEDIARALAPPGRLSSVEKDAIWGRVMATRSPWWRRRSARAGIGVAAGAFAVCAAAILVLRPAPPREALVSRGVGNDALTLRCGADREPGVCGRGDRLVFDFAATSVSYVALFARAPDGTVIWYLPADEAAASVAFAERASAGVLDAAALIDASYASGRYELFAVLSDAPLTRADIRTFARGERLVAPPGARIVTRTFVVGEEAL